MTHDEIRALANRIRVHILKMTYKARTSHIGSGYSAAELLAVLYGSVLKVDPKNPTWDKRDRFVLSKGHAAAAAFATLAECGFFPLEKLETFCQNGSFLPGHISAHKEVPGVEVSTGSLGHGLGIATGMALAAKRDQASHRVITVLSDGECDEGSTWEAALFAPHHKLDNLTAIVDYNKIQSLGHVKEVLDLEPLGEKWKSFGWAVREVDGHDVAVLEETLEAAPFETGKPSCIVANTVKGKGVSFMEDDLLWHYRAADPKEYEKAIKELGASQ